MRILLYNWAPLFTPASEGGGVELYLANLAERLVEAGHEVWVVSSGYRYSLFSGGLRWIRRRPKGKSSIQFFDLINAPVVAPSFRMSAAPLRTLSCPELVASFRGFMNENGPFDIVHIQNIEGISFDVLRLSDVFPQTAFVLSNHNYHVICPQVNLWHQDKERCTDFLEGGRCYSCNIFGPADDAMVIDRYIRTTGLEQRSWSLTRLMRKAARPLLTIRRCRGALPWDPPPDGSLWQGRRIGPADANRLRRSEALALVNRHCAAVLSVSRATERILLDHGLDPAISRVVHIGTRHHRPGQARPSRQAARNGAPGFRMAFLGYTRPDKGFHFLVRAIERMPDRLRGRLSLLVAARITDQAEVARLRRLRDRFSELEIRDGYAQADLPDLLSNVDLGLVLPQWDDALPQVAIEFVCHGVPILVSDRGGQQELAADPAFVFPAENSQEFWRKLMVLLDTPSELDRFWELQRPLFSAEEHAYRIIGIYRELSQARAVKA